MINLMLWPKFWVLHVRADMVDVLSVQHARPPRRCSDHVRHGEPLELFRTLLQCAEGFLAWEALKCRFWQCCVPVRMLRLSCYPASVISTTSGVSRNQPRVLILLLWSDFLTSLLSSLMQLPPLPTSAATSVLNAAQEKGAHASKGLVLTFSVETESAEIWNAPLVSACLLSCFLCRCIIIYLLQQNCDGTFLFEPLLPVRSSPTCNLLWIL